MRRMLAIATAAGLLLGITGADVPVDAQEAETANHVCTETSEMTFSPPLGEAPSGTMTATGSASCFYANADTAPPRPDIFPGAPEERTTDEPWAWAGDCRLATLIHRDGGQAQLLGGTFLVQRWPEPDGRGLAVAILTPSGGPGSCPISEATATALSIVNRIAT